MGGGRENQNGLAALGHGRAPDEIQHAGDARIIVDGHGVGGHLAGEIHGHGHVDGNHAVVPADNARVVDIV